jgi:soluble lytic murein transglycosylase-like protein
MLLPNPRRGSILRPNRTPSASVATATEAASETSGSRGRSFGRSCVFVGLAASVVMALASADPVFAGTKGTRAKGAAKIASAKPTKRVERVLAKELVDGETVRTAKRPLKSTKEKMAKVTGTKKKFEKVVAETPRKVVAKTAEKSVKVEKSVKKAPVNRTYRVKPGDSLTLIAFRQDTTVETLRAMNGLKAKQFLRVDQVLQVPPLADPNGLPLRLRRTPERMALRKETARWAKRNQIPVDLLEATLWHESGFNQSRVSSTGAIGIGQLMPGTSDFIERELIGQDLDPHNPAHNIRMSARYLRFLLEQSGGDSTKALYAYYQGSGSIRARGLYDDTILYARNVQSLRKRFRNH